MVGVDLPGHGARTHEPVPTSLQALGERVASDLAAADVRAPLLVGHSAGAAVALWLADSSVGALGVFAIDPPMLMPDEVTGAMADLANELRAGAGSDALRAFAEQSFFVPQTPAAVRERVLATLMTTPPDAVAALLDATRSFDAEAALRRVRVPTRVVLAAVPVDVPRLRRLVPSARIEQLEHTGHYSQLEHPDALSDQIAAFARELQTA